MTTLVRFDPYREATALQGEMARFLTLFGGATGTATAGVWAPAMDVWETDDEIVYAFDLPGISEDKISVELEDNALTVSGERERTDEVKDDRFYRFERRFGSFSRTIGLPQGTSEDGIKADYSDGVLQIHVRKPEEPKPRRIQVGSVSGGATIEGTSTPTES